MPVGARQRKISRFNIADEVKIMATAHAIPQSGIHEVHHEDVGFWRTYVFSTDHKVIGIQYGVTGLFFLFFGFCLMPMMRLQIAHPVQAWRIRGPLLSSLCGRSDPTA